tara:strand:- start:12939 stop:13526 length:588 start_codon:yes stop_codon:yes gene_type:complete
MEFERKVEFERPEDVTDDRHWAWILLVVAGTNAAAAAREVGYTHKYSKNQGARLKARYISVIKKLIAEDLEYLESNAHRILADTAALAFSSVANYIDIINVEEERDEEGNITIEARQILKFKPFEEIDPADIRAIKRLETSADGIKIWLHDKVKPLELLGQHENLWGKDATEKVSIVHNSYYGEGEPPDFPRNDE